MDRHLSPDIEIASPSLCSILRGAGLLTSFVRAAYEMSQRYNGNLELHERPVGQSFNPRIARITELGIQGGINSELMVAACMLGVSKLTVQTELDSPHTLGVHDGQMVAALSLAAESLAVPGSVINQAIAIDNLRRAHLINLDSRQSVVAAADQTARSAQDSALTPVLLKAISRYKSL